jgi:hypothetical protein
VANLSLVCFAYMLGHSSGYAKREREQVAFEDTKRKRLSL